jgi:acyl-CoA thioesterase-1
MFMQLSVINPRPFSDPTTAMFPASVNSAAADCAAANIPPRNSGFVGNVRTLLVALTALATVVGCTDPAPTPSQEVPSEVDTAAGKTDSDPSKSSSDSESTDAVRVLFLGDSITAGYGIDRANAFPTLLETRLRQAGYTIITIDAGVSGDTSTGGLNRLDWLLQNRVDVLVLELGGNDGLRGIDVALTRSNLGTIVERTRAAWPSVEVVIVGMQVPPNLGQEYTSAFASIYPEVASERGTHFVPFLANGFGDIVHLLQSDGIHPTEEGHRLIADRIEVVLKPLMSGMLEER